MKPGKQHPQKTLEPHRKMGSPPSTGWEHVASWYDHLIEEKRSDHHDDIVIPGVVNILNPQKGQHILDIACGQGILMRQLDLFEVISVGVDASPALIHAAKQRSSKDQHFLVADARHKELYTALSKHAPFHSACCVLALMNMNPVDMIFKNVFSLLKPGGIFVIVILHPAFRSPGLTDWHWEQQHMNNRALNDKGNPKASKSDHLLRRSRGYLSKLTREIIMNPGNTAKGGTPIKTHTYHRPIQDYIRLFTQAGFLVNGFEEWVSQRKSSSGPRALEENRMRAEIPMFLTLSGKKVSP